METLSLALCRHPIALATESITSAGSDIAALTAAYSQLAALLGAAQAQGLNAVQEACAVAVRASTLSALLSSIRELTPQLEAGHVADQLKVG
jgi:hypothetical protein